MKVLAIDPGYDRLGVAVLEHSSRRETLLHSDCVFTNKQNDVHQRMSAAGEVVERLLATYQPDALAIETLFFNKNQKTALRVAETRGIVLYLACRNGCAVREFSPQEVKVATTGYGKSDKRAVADMVRRMVRGAPQQAFDDEYDAIAVGVTCLVHDRRG